MDLKRDVQRVSRQLLSQFLLIGIIYSAAQIFGYLEAEIFNTFLNHVLQLSYLYVTLMVVLSAITGLVAQPFLGTASDNTRSKFGRRRPFLLIGGLIAGVAMILYAFSGNYLMAIILDVIAVGIASNAYYVAQRALIPDLIDIEYRGRANSWAYILGNIGLIIAIAIFLLLNELFGITDPFGILNFFGIGTIITRAGYIFALSIGGGIFISIGAIGFLLIKEKSVSELPPKNAFFEDFKKLFNVEEFRKNKEFYKIVLAYTMFWAGVQTILPYLFIYIFDLGFSTMTLLIIIGVAAPILFIVIHFIGKLADKHGRKKFIPFTILLSCIGFFIIPFLSMTTPVLPLYIFAFTLVLINVLGTQTILDAFYQDLLPEHERGKFIGIMNITQTASQVIGATLGGIVATIFGIVAIFAFAPIFFVISIPLFMRVKETLPGIEN